MSYVVREWLNLAVRWTHVFAAIMWVGQTYFFTWLDHTFQNEKQVWMVHSGGFYCVEAKRRGAARVLGVDGQRQHVRQALFVRKVLGLDLEFRRFSVYDLKPETVGVFDITLAW